MLLPPESPAQRLGCPVDASHPVCSHKVNHAGQGGTRTRACLSFQPGGNQGTRSGRAAGGSFSDTTKTLAGPDPCWLDHGPQSWLLGRISSPFFPGSPPAPETRTGLEWPGHGSFWNCSGVFTDNKEFKDTTQTPPVPVRIPYDSKRNSWQYHKSSVGICFKKGELQSSRHGSTVTNPTRIHEDVGVIPGLAQ